MTRIFRLLVLTILITHSGISDTFAEIAFAEKVKNGINKLGTGDTARVEVKLNNKMKLRGYIKETEADYFILATESREMITIPYSQVTKVKGFNLTQGEKVLIEVGLSIAALLLILTFVYGD